MCPRRRNDIDEVEREEPEIWKRLDLGSSPVLPPGEESLTMGWFYLAIPQSSRGKKGMIHNTTLIFARPEQDNNYQVLTAQPGSRETFKPKDSHVPRGLPFIYRMPPCSHLASENSHADLSGGAGLREL